MRCCIKLLLALLAVSTAEAADEAQLWLDAPDAAFAAAATVHKPALLLFSSPDCRWCVKLKTELADDPKLKELMGKFVAAAIDVSTSPREAAKYLVEGVPTLALFAADGRPLARRDGYAGPDDTAKLLSSVLNQNALATRSRQTKDLLKILDQSPLSSQDLAASLLAMAESQEVKDEIKAKLFKLPAPPVKELLELLENRTLAVRLGALEILEELAGDDFDFDPWLTSEANAAALAKWRAWAKRPEATQSAKQLFAPLTAPQFERAVAELLSSDRARSDRARRRLESGGPGAVPQLDAYLRTRPTFPAGTEARLRELKYSLLLSDFSGKDAKAVLRRLLYGNLDGKLESLALLKQAGPKAAPVLEDFLADPDPMVREAAAEALAKAAGRGAAAALATQAKREKDQDTLFTILRVLGETPSPLSADALASFLDHPDEDIVVAALAALGARKAKKHADAIAARLVDPRWRVRVAALEALGKCKLDSQANAVEKLLGDPDQFVRHKTVEALAAISNKRSAKKLAEAFMADDNLKGAVVKAYGELDLDIPPSFVAALAGKSPQTLFQVVQALENCGDRGAALATALAKNPDPDVACPALAFLVGRGLNKNGAAALATAALASGDPDQLRAVAAEGAVKFDEDSRDRAKLRRFIERLDQGGAQAPAAPKAAPPKLDGLFASFGADTAATAPEDDQAALERLVVQMRRSFRETQDKEVKFGLARILASCGDDSMVDYFKTALLGRNAAARQEVYSALAPVKSTKALELFALALRDDDEENRAIAAEALMDSKRPKSFRALLDELAAPDAKAQVEKLFSRAFAYKIGGDDPGRKIFGDWARKLLESKQGDAKLQVFALTLLGKNWRSKDKATTEGYLKAANPFVRRAAYLAVLRNCRPDFQRNFLACAADPSEFVRRAAPESLKGNSAERTIQFSDLELARYWDWDSSGAAARDAVAPEIEAALGKLARDPAPLVRLDSDMALAKARKPVDMKAFVELINQFPDNKSIAADLTTFMKDNYQRLGDEYAALLPYLDEERLDAKEKEKLYKRFASKPAPDAPQLVVRAAPAPPAPAPEPKTTSDAAPLKVKLLFFFKAGCQDCLAVERLLKNYQSAVPELTVERHDLGKIDEKLLDEAYCEKFQVPETSRLVAPAIFAAAGQLSRGQIDQESLGRLIARSGGVPDADWMAAPQLELKAADTRISERYHRMGYAVIAAAGLLDGVNPCAFATIIFFMSYLRLARRTPREVALVGLAFIAGVFVAYFAIGLGFAELFARFHVARSLGEWLRWGMTAFCLILMALSLYDGVLCLRGRLADISLQLPESFKARIRTSVREGSRQRRFVWAALVTGALVSFLEFACTGQVYAPTILYMLQTGAERLGAIFDLLLFNVCFIVPLAGVFAAAYFGLKNEALATLALRHAAWVKFATAALFLCLAAYLNLRLVKQFLAAILA